MPDSPQFPEPPQPPQPSEAPEADDAVSDGDSAETQPALLDDLAPAPAPAMPAGTAARDPVATVLLDSAVPHLDRLFDYTEIGRAHV